MFNVVYFPAEQKYAIVRNTWLSTCSITHLPFCYWPDGSNGTGNMLHVEKPSVNWSRIFDFEIKISVPDIRIAKEKLEKCIANSEIDTEYDENCRPIRKAKKRAASVIDSPPRHSFEGAKQSRTTHLKSPPAFNSSSSPAVVSKSSTVYTNVNRDTQPSYDDFGRILHDFDILLDIDDCSDTSQSRTLPSRPKETLVTKSSSLSSTTTSKCVEKILKNQAVIMKQNEELLRNQITILNLLHEKGFGVEDEAEFLPPDISLPLSTSQQLNTLNKWLQDEHKNRKKFSGLISCIGGLNENESIRNIMKKLISNKLAMEYNWIGKGEKQAFSDNKTLLKCIFGMLRKKYITLVEINLKNVIQEWLKNAKSRHRKKTVVNMSTTQGDLSTSDSQTESEHET